MPLPATKVFLATAATGSGGYRLTPQEAGDFALPGMGVLATALGDLNGDGIGEVAAAAPGNSDQSPGAGRVYVTFGSATGGGAIALGDSATQIRIDGALANDHVGFALAAIGSQDAGGRNDLLVGAPLADTAGRVDAGGAYVVFLSATPKSIDLNDLASGGSGEGFLLRGEAAGDRAGSAVAAIADLNGDGRQDILVGAPGNDAGGAGAGAAYVVWGKASDAPLSLAAATAGTAGFRLTGEAAGDAAGTAIAAIADLDGDGKAEIVIGAPGNDDGGNDAGAAYVVFGKAGGAAVSLADVANGIGGFRITGHHNGDRAGASVAAIGDVNGDGKTDLLIGSTGLAYVVYGKAGTAEVKLSDVRNGIGGFAIRPVDPADIAGLVVAGGRDLNRDGIADLVIGAPGDTEGGAGAGAAYVVWGGGGVEVDLGLVAQGAGGAKIVGRAGSRTGSSVALAADMNGDGAAELLIGAPGAGTEAAYVLYAPAAWQPDRNVYGSNDADAIGAGFGGLHAVGAGADSIYGFDGADSIAAGGGADLLEGGAGADTLAGGSGDDTYVLADGIDVVVELPGAGADTVLAAASITLADGVEALRLTASGRTGTGNGGDNLMLGSAGADTLRGLAGADTLVGNAGNDSLDGGPGADSLVGGAGNDTYRLDVAADLVVELAGGGADTVVAGFDATIGGGIEALVLSGTARRATGSALAEILGGGANADTLSGLGGADTLLGGANADRLDGGLGADSMVGGAGNDRYRVDDALDRILELAGGGADTVEASVGHTLAAEVEVLVLTGTARRGTGNASANRILGTAGGDTLDGGLGADTLGGLGGNDLYRVDEAGDRVEEAAGGGADTIAAALDWTLGAEIEALVLTGGAHAGTGNALANRLAGGDGADSLAGLAGADTLEGGAGGDTLEGGTGGDSLVGGAGNDLFYLDASFDKVVELAGGGADTVIAAVNATLAGGVETLVLAGAATRGTGNAGDNRLVGGGADDLLAGAAGADTLEGGAGADTMDGGAGNDTFLVTDPGDTVVEGATGGFDTVIVSTDWTLAANIEAVQLLGSGHALTGNAAANLLSGNAGGDTLDGGEGDDTLLAGDGDDLLVCASGADTLSGGAGDDRFEVHGGRAHIEDFLGHDTLDASEATGDSHIDLSGETDSEIEGEVCDLGQGGSAAGPLDVQFLQDLTGSFADDIATVRGLVPQIVAALAGVQPDSSFGVSSFRDKPVGGFGNAGDWVYRQEAALAADTAALTAAYGAMVAANGADGPEAQIEALMQLALHVGDVGFRTNSARFVVLFTDAPFHVAGDGAGAGIVTPNDGDAVLDGTPPGTGEDYPAIAQLKAALEAANLIPVFCVTAENVAAYHALTLQLGRGAEVTLTADSSNVVAAITAGLTEVTRTTLEDAVGGAGADTLRGNAAANDLEGNDGNDLLVGGDGADTLRGEAGADTLDGGAGADSLAGGLGNDSYVVDDAGDVVVEQPGQGTDLVTASLGWTLGAGIENLTLAGSAAIDGTGNAAANQLRGNGGANALAGLGGHDSLYGFAGADSLAGGAGNDRLDGGLGADSLAGGAGNDSYLVDAAADLVIEQAGEGIDRVTAGLSWSLAAEVENLTLGGTGGFSGTGNAAANVLTGNAGANLLAGLGGADSLAGGAGNDTLAGGAGSDRAEGGAGLDLFRFASLEEIGDTLVDFTTLVDRIEVSAAGFGGGLAAGANLAAQGRFVGGVAATDAIGQFLWDAATGRLDWDADGTGASAAVTVARLGAGLALAASDLVVVA